MAADLSNKTAIVTGASRGIGAAIAGSLAAKGVHLVITGRDRQALAAEEKSLLRSGVKVLSIAEDLMDPDSPGRIVSKAVDFLGSLDFLINNAGVGRSGSYKDLTVPEWDIHMTVNARAPFFLCQYSIPYLMQSKNPAIVNIASVTATRSYAEQAAYSASKHALLGWTKSLAKELHDTGIRVHTISPGGVATDMIRIVRPDINASEMIDPQEIADLLIFLISRSGKGMIDDVSVRRESKTPWL